MLRLQKRSVPLWVGLPGERLAYATLGWAIGLLIQQVSTGRLP